MPLHTNTFEALAGVEAAQLPGRPANGQLDCEGAKFHSPSPLLLHEVELDGGRIVTLCGVCRDNLAALKTLLILDPALSWEIRREFGNRLRELAPNPTQGDPDA